MPSSVVRTFSDADDYVAAIRQGAVEATVTSGGNFAGKITKIDLHHLWMQRLWENLPRIYRVDGGAAEPLSCFALRPDQACCIAASSCSPTTSSDLAQFKVIISVPPGRRVLPVCHYH
jgi:hypothetical protein